MDRNVCEVNQAEWDWADLVILSAMIVQKEDLLKQIQEAKRRGKRVAVGGPYATALPQEVMEVGADYLILDEGEITLPLFTLALARGERSGAFESYKRNSFTGIELNNQSSMFNKLFVWVSNVRISLLNPPFWFGVMTQAVTVFLCTSSPASVCINYLHFYLTPSYSLVLKWHFADTQIAKIRFLRAFCV